MREIFEHQYHSYPNHHSRRVDDQFVSDAALLLTMTRNHRQILLRDHPRAFPKTFMLTEFIAITNTLSTTAHSLNELVSLAHSLRSAARTPTDVIDPYRQDFDVYRRVGSELDANIDALARQLIATA